MKIHIRLWLATLMTVAFSVFPVTAQTLFKPVAVVNESIITGFDLAQRTLLLSIMEGQNREPLQFRRQALESLIVDRLKVLAGEKIGLVVTSEIAKIGFNLFSEQNGREPKAFRKKLNEAGISNQAIDDFILAETIWSEVVRARFLSRAEPSQTQVDEELRLNADLINTSYKLRELGLHLTGHPESDSQKREQITRIYNDLRRGQDFDQAVRQFSETPSAVHGGALGWIKGQELPIDMVRNLNSLKIGQITPPINTQNGIAILQLVERRKEGKITETHTIEEEQRKRTRQHLLSEEIARLANGYLQEIRRDAFIELQ